MYLISTTLVFVLASDFNPLESYLSDVPKSVFAHFTECVDVYPVGVNIQHLVDLDVPRLCRGVIVPRRYK